MGLPSPSGLHALEASEGEGVTPIEVAERQALERVEAARRR